MKELNKNFKISHDAFTVPTMLHKKDNVPIKFYNLFAKRLCNESKKFL
jgi:hypothetical protein